MFRHLRTKMPPKTVTSSVLEAKFNELFTPTIKATTQKVIKFKLYLVTLVGTVIVYNKCFDELNRRLHYEWAAHLAILLPLALVFFFDTLPETWALWLRRKRSLARIGGDVPGDYFKLSPIDNPTSFNREDNAHIKALTWLTRQQKGIRYLTGLSGVGKSSLLIWLVHQLQTANPGWKVLELRSYADPLEDLREQCIKPDVFWKAPPDDLKAKDPKELLSRASKRLETGAKILILFDQFEELMLIHENDRPRVEAVAVFLRDLEHDPLPNVQVLVSFREDYQGLIERLQLPSLHGGHNWFHLDPFTEAEGLHFLEKSGLKFESEETIPKVIEEASRYEGRKGLVRPIILNLIGMILNRARSVNPERWLRELSAGRLLVGYVRESILNADRNDLTHIVLARMLTTSNTTNPRSLDELVAETKISKERCISILQNLSQDGLVREIDHETKVWQIAHDFMAALIGQVLGRGTRTAYQTATPYVLLMLAIGWGIATLAWTQTIRNQESLAGLDLNSLKIQWKFKTPPPWAESLKKLAFAASERWFYSKDDLGNFGDHYIAPIKRSLHIDHGFDPAIVALARGDSDITQLFQGNVKGAIAGYDSHHSTDDTAAFGVEFNGPRFEVLFPLAADWSAVVSLGKKEDDQRPVHLSAAGIDAREVEIQEMTRHSFIAEVNSNKDGFVFEWIYDRSSLINAVNYNSKGQKLSAMMPKSFNIIIVHENVDRGDYLDRLGNQFGNFNSYGKFGDFPKWAINSEITVIVNGLEHLAYYYKVKNKGTSVVDRRSFENKYDFRYTVTRFHCTR